MMQDCGLVPIDVSIDPMAILSYLVGFGLVWVVWFGLVVVAS